MNKRVTYLLGAGASYNAVPVVDELNYALDRYIKDLQNKYGSQKYGSFFSDLLGLKNKIQLYSTADTAAKVFFHSEGRDSKELLRLKTGLNCLFNLFQIQRPVVKSSQGITITKKEFDQRYFKLIAYYLFGNESSTALPNELNFVNWNYDNQLERAYRFFLRNKTFTDSLSVIKSIPHSRIIIEPKQPELLDAKVVHLNGRAGIVCNEGKLIELDDWQELHVLSKDDRIEKLMASHPSRSNECKNLISFAWEADQENIRVQTAKEKFSETDILVVIGYSFPGFNRQVDQALFNQLPKHTQIYVQDKNEELAPTISQIFGLSQEAKHIGNVQEFFIPPGV